MLATELWASESEQVLLAAELSVQPQHFVLFEIRVLPCSTSWSGILGDPLASTSPSAGIAVMSHHSQQHLGF